MRKDFANREFARKRALQKKVLLYVIAAALFLAIAFWGYHIKKTSAMSEKTTAWMSQFKTWVAERKNHLHPNLNKTAKVAENKSQDESQEIHFEFYNTLPTMQVSVVEPATTDDTKQKSVEHVAESTPEKITKALAKKTSPKPVTLTANELEQAISEEINKHKRRQKKVID